MAEEIVIRVTAKDDASKVLNQISQSVGRLSGSGRGGIGGLAKPTKQAGMGFLGMAGSVAAGTIAAKAATVAISAVAGVVAGSFSGLVRYGDAWQGMSNRLRLFAKDAKEVAETQEALFKLANQTRSAMGPTVELYQRFAMANETLGLTQTELLKVTKTVNEAIQISGVTSEAASAAITQLGQGMASGVLGGDELRSVMEQVPGVAQAIADGMGITVAELRKFRKNGGIAAEEVTKALLKTESTSAKFGKTVRTLGVEMVILGNVQNKIFGKLSKDIGLNRKLGDALGVIVDLLQEMDWGPITLGFQNVIAAIEQLLPGGEAAGGFLKTIGEEWIPKALMFTMGFVNGINLIIDTVTLLWDTGKMVVKNFAEIDWFKIFMQLPKVFTAHTRGMLSATLSLVTNIYGYWEKSVGVIMSLFNVNFGGLWDWIATSFKKFVAGPVLEAAGWMLGVIVSHIPRLADRLQAFRDGISDANQEIVNLPKPNFNFAEDFKATIDAAKLLTDHLSSTASEAWNAYMVEIGNAGDALLTIADTIDQTGSLRARLEALKAQGSNLFQPLVESAGDAVDAQEEVAAAAEQKASRFRAAWDLAFKSIKDGVAAYKKTLKSFASDLTSATTTMFKSVETGLTDAIGTVLFGDDAGKALEDSIEQIDDLQDAAGKLREFLQFDMKTSSEAGAIISAQDFGRAIDGMLKSLDDMNSSDLPDRFKNRIEDLTGTINGFSLGSLTEEEIQAFMKDLEDLAEDMENDAGVKGRWKRAGKAFRTEMVKGFQTELTVMLSRALIRSMWSAVTSSYVTGLFKRSGTQMAGEANEGFRTGIHEQDGIGDFLGGGEGESTPDRFGWIRKQLKSAFDFTTENLDKFWNATKGTFSGLWVGLKSAFNFSTEKLDKFWDVTKGTFSALGSGLKSAFNFSTEKLDKFWGATKDTFKGLKEGLGSAFNFSTEKLDKFWTATKGTFSKLGSGLKSAFTFSTGKLDKFWTATKDTFSKLGSGLETAFTFSTGKLDKFWDATASTFSGLRVGLWNAFSGPNSPDTSRFNRFWDATVDTFNLLGSGLEKAFSFSTDRFNKFFSPAADAFKSLKKGLEAVFSGIDLSGFTDLFKADGSVGQVLGNNAAAALVAGFAGSQIGKSIGRMFGPNGEIGAEIGGGVAGVLMVAAKVNPIVAALGTVAGSLIGGAIGKLLGGDEKEKFQKQQPVLQALFGQKGGLGGFIEEAGGAQFVQGAIRSAGFEGAADVLGQGKGGINRWLEQVILNEGLASTKEGARALVTQITAGEGIVATTERAEEVQKGGGTFVGGADLNLGTALFGDDLGDRSISLSMGQREFNAGFLTDYLEGQGLMSGSGEFNNALNWIRSGGINSEAADFLTEEGIALTARQGLDRVPGSVNQAFPAVLHGGERVLTNEQARSMDAGGGGITINLAVNGMGDEGILKLLRQRAIPEIQMAVERGIQNKARFGQFEMDSRSIRTVANI